ncbi:hypothetical protein K458DRAFT_392421 [Lentithecium fluviatile CBS 122367]|uniref:Uncharacterized protein n=1 Tax=Lentithecium fluviatile CBS 122367 TaxID=1168545 RepID=A0A6G1IR76_9PLEO|nr:hypothetical protein K458DRAFT_392421 [Lentithecium fluviatile CBS 122367]
MTGLLNLLVGPALNGYESDKPPITSLMARFPASIKEDNLNKPWRPIPSKRLSPSQSTTLWYYLHLAVMALGTFFDTIPFTAALLLLDWLYNNCEGGSNPLARNLINACAVVCLALGATIVAYGGNPFILNEKG